MSLKFLGRGSAFNVKEGNTSAYIKDNGKLILFDCGESIFQRILEKELLNDILEVEVYITHLNSDHVGSLSSLIYYCYYVKKMKIKISFPKIDKLVQLLSLNGNTSEQYDLLYAYDFVSIVSVSHIANMNCYGYVFKYNNKRYYYSGDSNEIPSFIINDLKNNVIDIIYQDTCLADYDGNVHLSLRKLSELIPSELRSKVYCMHIDSDDTITKAKELGFNVVEIN